MSERRRMGLNPKEAKIFLWIGGSVALAVACCIGSFRVGDTGTHSREISRAEVGDDWPLTVDSGTVECRNGSEVVFAAGGQVYAVNGSAMSTRRYADLLDIWTPDPDMPGVRVNISPVLAAGLALC